MRKFLSKTDQIIEVRCGYALKALCCRHTFRTGSDLEQRACPRYRVKVRAIDDSLRNVGRRDGVIEMIMPSEA
jgi:hypothetical protein